MSADAYAVLGVSPESEDVVIRAAYRALMQKYTSLSRLDADVMADDRRAREIQAAYDHVEAMRRAPAAPESAPLQPPTPEPEPTLRPSPEPWASARSSEPPPPEPDPAAVPDALGPLEAGPPAAAAARPRIGAGPWLIAATLAALAAVGAAMVLSPEREAAPAPAAYPGLKVKLTHAAPAASLARPLPCFVGGKPIGELRLADCAARNGVATGPLELPQPSAGDPAGAEPLPLVPQPAAPAPVIALAPPHPASSPVAPAARPHVRSEPRFARDEPPSRPAERPQARPKAFAALDKALRDPLATLLHAVTQPPAPPPAQKPAARVKSQARATPASAPAPAPAEDHLDHLLAMLAPLVRPAEHAEPAPRAEAPARAEPQAEHPAEHPAERPAERVEVSAPVRPAERPTARQSLAVVRGFYEALGDGDGETAVSLVAPEKRQEGPLSAGRIRKFYSAVRQPLRLTAIRPLDDATVLVRYQFVAPGDRLCEGVANVGTTSREQAVLIDQIHARYACQG